MKTLEMIDDNRSFWAAVSPSYTPNPSLKGMTKADLAIVGGGYAGVSAAYHFSRRYPEKRVVLLEAKYLANGASGRSGGQMLNFLTGTDHNSEEALSESYKITQSVIDEIFTLIKRHNLSVSSRKGGALKAITNDRNAEIVREEVEKFQKIGIPLQFLDQHQLESELGLQNVKGALLDPHSGHINGVQFIRALRPVLIEQGIEIYENTPVLKICEGSEVTLTTPKGQVRAKAILLATNAYTPSLGYYKNSIFPINAHITALLLKDEETKTRLCHGKYSSQNDDYTRLVYMTFTPEGYALIGGSYHGYKYVFGSKTKYKNGEKSKIVAQKQRDVYKNFYPDNPNAPIKYHWSGPVALHLGRCNGMVGVRGSDRNIFHTLGFNAHGVLTANLTGKIFTDMYSGDDQKWRHLPLYKPSLPPIPPEPLRWLTVQIYFHMLAPKRSTDVII